MNRGRKTDRELNALLDAAEQQRRCLVPPDRPSAEAFRRRIRTGEVMRPFPRMIVRTEYWESLQKIPRAQWRLVQNAYKDRYPDDALCSFSAALEYGLWVSKTQLNKIHVVSPSPSHVRVSRYVHRHYRPSSDLVTVNGVKLTTLMRTVLDCSLDAAFPEGLAIADSAIRFCALDLDLFRTYVWDHATGCAGAQRARMVAAFADGRAENGGESIVRGKIIELGYVAPSGLQVEFEDPVAKGSTFRVDMLFSREDGAEVICEVDGWDKYGETARETKHALVKERQRESHLTALGLPVMRILFGRINEPGYLDNVLQSYGIPKRDSTS